MVSISAVLDPWKLGSMKSLCLLPMADSIGVLPLRVTCVFLTVAALRINWAGVICDRVVWSGFLEAVSTSAERNFLNDRTPIPARFGQGVCGPVGSPLHMVHSIKCLHVMRMMESHIYTIRLRIHLKSVHPFMKFGDEF